MINLKQIFEKISTVSQNDIKQDDETGSTTIYLEDKAFEFIMRNLDSANNSWIKTVDKEKNKLIITSEWKTIFIRK